HLLPSLGRFAVLAFQNKTTGVVGIGPILLFLFTSYPVPVAVHRCKIPESPNGSHVTLVKIRMVIDMFFRVVRGRSRSKKREQQPIQQDQKRYFADCGLPKSFKSNVLHR